MICDNIVERNSIALYNMNTSDLGTNVWSTASGGYGFYTIKYNTPLSYGETYFVTATYKYTTTNQKPTWCTVYSQNGSASTPATVSNPVAGTEYTLTGVFTVSPNATFTLESGTIYNGPSNSISGVQAQVKNVCVYRVTELLSALRSSGITDTTSWLKSNLGYTPYNTPKIVDLSLLSSSNSDTVQIYKGAVIADNFIEPDGMTYYSTAMKELNKISDPWFDSGNPLDVYNNSGGGTVTHTRISAASVNSPFIGEHKYVLKIVTNGTASPGAGGFVVWHQAKANGVFIERFVAKVPVGYTINSAFNSQGTGYSVTYLTDREGTGDWKEYAILYKCGSSGSFSSGGHVYISGSNNTSVTWYVAYANNCDITNNESLKDYTIMNYMNIKKGICSSYSISNNNILVNGNGLYRNSSYLPSGWEYDTSDIAGEGYASFVQPVNATSGGPNILIPVEPSARYKISYWVKCKQDMTSFLTAIQPILSDGTTTLNHNSVVYVSGTKTTLAQSLNNGDTTVTLTSAANWKIRSYSSLGFRSSNYKSYNDLSRVSGSSEGLITAINGSVLTLRTAYSGSTVASGTRVVESYDGGNWLYPISKTSLPTDNTWKYVEGYFGNSVMWDGNDANGSWYALPADTRYIGVLLNLYANTGTVPIKYCDVKIQKISGSGHSDYNQVQVETRS